MKNRNLFLFAAMTTSLLFGATAAQARFKFAFAQPLAPGAIGICWRTLEEGKSVRLYRVTPGGETRLGEFDASRDSFVDSHSFEPGEIVHYRLAEVAGAKESFSTPLAASNSAELIAGGDFETPSPSSLSWPGFTLSLPAPLKGEVVQGGAPSGGQYLKITMPDGKLRYSLRKPFVWVRPPTKYTFSFWTTNPTPILAKGSISIFTEELKKSAFAKVTWYRLSPAQQKEGWVKITQTRAPLKDERLAGLEVSPEPSDDSGSVGIDRFSIVDHDILYLETLDIPKAIQEAREGIRTSPHLAGADLAAILNEIEALQTSMASPSIPVDEFLARRASLCQLLRRLDSANAVFEIAKIP